MAKGRKWQHSEEETRGTGDLNFHYDREERLAAASDALRAKDDQLGFVRRYRGPLFLLFDILLLIGMIGLYLFLTSGDERARFPGYTVTMRAAQFGDQGLVTVEITQTEDTAKLAGDIVEVRMRVNGTSLQVDEKDVLPAAKGQKRIIRGVLQPLPELKKGSAHMVTVEVAVPGKVVRLSSRMREE